MKSDCTQPRKPDKSESSVGVLAAENGHDFDNIIVDAAADAVHAAHAAPVSRADMIDGGIGIRPFGYFLETVKQRVVITVRRRLTPMLQAIFIDAVQVAFGGFREFIGCHLSRL